MQITKTQTIDCTPTWSGLMPTLLQLVKEKGYNVSSEICDNIMKCAKVADKYVEVVNGNKGKKVKIVNGKFSWRIEIDGKIIPFQIYEDFFIDHFTNLGYDVSVDRNAFKTE